MMVAKNTNKKSEKENLERKNCNKKARKLTQKKEGLNAPPSKGQSSKPRTLKEALQFALSRDVVIKKQRGKEEKMTFLEALAEKTIADAIENDGPTRRLLFRQDFLDLTPKKEEVEDGPDSRDIKDVEREYGKLLREWAEFPPEMREKTSRMLSQTLIDLLNEKTRKGGNDE